MRRRGEPFEFKRPRVRPRATGRGFDGSGGRALMGGDTLSGATPTSGKMAAPGATKVPFGISRPRGSASKRLRKKTTRGQDSPPPEAKHVSKSRENSKTFISRFYTRPQPSGVGVSRQWTWEFRWRLATPAGIGGVLAYVRLVEARNLLAPLPSTCHLLGRSHRASTVRGGPGFGNARGVWREFDVCVAFGGGEPPQTTPAAPSPSGAELWHREY